MKIRFYFVLAMLALASAARAGCVPMTGTLYMGSNKKITKVLGIQWNARVTHGAICADANGNYMYDDKSGKYRFGVGSKAYWINPPSGNDNISSQILTCLKNRDGSYRWAHQEHN